MNGLEAYFDGQIEFVHLDTDNFQHRNAGQKVGLYRHTQYLLLDQEGNIVMQWNGYLHEDVIYEEILEALFSMPMGN